MMMGILDSVSPVEALNTVSVLASDGKSKLTAEQIRARTNVCDFTRHGEAGEVHLSAHAGARVSLCVLVRMKWAH